MEALQNYLFDNSEDFSNKHYINIMKLLLVAHVEIKKNNVPGGSDQSSVWHVTSDSFVEQSVSSERTVIITEEVWNTQIKELVENHVYSVSDPNLIPNKLKTLTEGPWEETRFIFPESLDTNFRRMIHCSRSGADDICVTRTYEGKLHYVIY